jgi:hypothetical protein
MEKDISGERTLCGCGGSYFDQVHDERRISLQTLLLVTDYREQLEKSSRGNRVPRFGRFRKLTRENLKEVRSRVL